MDLRISAVVAGAIGLVADVLLIAFYVDLVIDTNVAVDLGFANDVAMVPFALALMPVVAGVFVRTSPRHAADVAILVLGLSSTLVLVVAQLLLVRRIVTFEEQIGYASTASVFVVVWVVLAQWRAGDRLTRRTRRWGVVIGLSLPLALLLVSIGVWNQLVFWVGLAVGGVAWFSVVGWLLAFNEQRPAQADAAHSPRSGWATPASRTWRT